MDTDAYRAEMSTLIENGPHQLLKKDPTDRLTRKLSEKLLIRGHLQQDQTPTQTAAKNLRFTEDPLGRCTTKTYRVVRKHLCI